MITSTLLHFSAPTTAEAVLNAGMRVARRAKARVRGLTLVDTRRLKALAAHCESAVYASGETTRLERLETEQERVRQQVSDACLAAGLDFDVRRLRGNPLELLPYEAQFHDLIVTGYLGPAGAEEDGLAARELVDLLLEGVRPLLVVRRAIPARPRVLLVSDGAPGQAPAWRQFLHQQLFAEAELRLLAVGRSESLARVTLREMADYCRARGLMVETGWTCGALRQVLVPYAIKWSADVVVLGVPREHVLLRRMIGVAAERVLRRTDAALYALA